MRRGEFRLGRTVPRPRRAAAKFCLLVLLFSVPVGPAVAQLVSEIEFLSFDFVEMAGPAGHEGLFPIAGEPVRGFVYAALARLSGPIGTAEFRLVSKQGDPIGPIDLTRGHPYAGRQDFVGDFEPPSRRFHVAVSGLDSAGNPYDIVYPTLYRARMLRLGFDPASAVLLAGANTLAITLENFGPAGSFALDPTNSHGLVTLVDPPVLTLESGSAGSFEVALSVPLGLPDFTAVALDAAVTRAGDLEVLNGGSLVLMIEDGNTLTAAMDSTLRRYSRHRNEGANPWLHVGRGREPGGDDDDRGVRLSGRPIISFDAVAIDAFVDANGLSRAMLTLTIADNWNNWEGGDQTVDARPVFTDFTEGNGMAAGLPVSDQTRGFGAGVTWRCTIDEDISNRKRDCDRRWRGGNPEEATAAPAIHFDGQAGTVMWDVTEDVAFGGHAWIVQKNNEFDEGRLLYFSREGAKSALNAELGPRLMLE